MNAKRSFPNMNTKATHFNSDYILHETALVILYITYIIIHNVTYYLENIRDWVNACFLFTTSV